MTVRPARRIDECICNASMGQEHARGCPLRYQAETCHDCTYDMRAHVDGRCPTEDQAVRVWGRS